jgi:PTS system galactitol-specific IIC component
MIEQLSSVLQAFLSFKAYVMLPIVILVIALLLRMRVVEALVSALRLGVGFAGVFVAFNFFVENVSPAVEALAQNRGLEFPVLDVGWPPLAAITWSSLIAPISIPLVIILNIIMLATNTTRTIYIDMWNIWHFALIGALVQNLTGSLLLGLLATFLITVYALKTCDWSAPYIRKEIGLTSVTVSPVSVTGQVPFAVVMDRLYSRIPGFRKLEYNPEKRGKEIGAIGEPIVIGAIVGILLGLAAAYSVAEILELCVHLSVVMFLIPVSAGMIAEGFKPISSHLNEIIKRRFPNKGDLYVAVHTGIVLGHKSTITTALILMPISLVLALVLPGNRTLPLGDLPNLISVMALITLAHGGNVIRAVITGTPIVV